MAITRPKEYKNFVPPDTGKAYRISGNADGTSKITDVTQYLFEGDTWTAADANMIWDELENVITDDEKGVAGGVASLNANGKLVQMPTAADVGAAPTTMFGTSEKTEGSASSYPEGTLYFVVEG